MLKLICGESGTGKSTLLRDRIKSAALSGKSAVLFVPDQFSFEAEKLMYRTIPKGYAQSCRVTMFSKEAQRILREHGETKEYADDIAKRIVVKLALEEAGTNGELEYYRSQTRRKGFPAFALNMIADMRSAGVSPAELRGVLAKDIAVTDALGGKLNDIAVIYSAYDRILTENFDDKLDDVRRASELILQTDVFGGCEVFLDEFDSFSGSQLAFIRAMLSKADNVTLAITCDYPDGRERKFEAARKLLSQLSQNVQTDVTLLTRRYRKPSSLTVIEARDKWQECDWICSEIRSLMDGGARCRDIAVLIPDSGTARILDSTAKRYEIPAFSDIPEPLITKWFVRFPIYTLKALSFGTQDILRYTKSGFVRDADGAAINSIKRDSDSANKLESLCRRFDLRRKDWLRLFPEGIDKTGELEELRKSVILPLQQLMSDIGIEDITEKTDGAELTRLLCDFLCNKMRVTGTIKSRCIGRDANGKITYDRRLLDEFCEIWDDMITVFESAYKALRGHYVTVEEYTEILTDIFTSTTIAKPPQTLDAVTFGDTSRSRFTDVKYVFICGFNRGIMPPPAKLSDVFTPNESEQLSQLGIPIAADRLSRYSQELYTVYRCTGIPSEKLYITYPLTSENGAFLEPSDALSELKSEFCADTVGADNFGAAHYCRTNASAERYLARIFRDSMKIGERRALMKLVNADFAEMLRSAAGEKPYRDRHRLDGKTASGLLIRGSYSPSALGLMNRCKFAYFCRYGLGIYDESERAVDPQLAGNVIHYCLQQLLTDNLGSREAFLKMSDSDISEHVRGSIVKYEKEYYFGGFGGTERFSYMLSRLGRYAVRSAVRIRDELASSGFYPEALEKRLSFPFGDVTIDGRCDRLDSMSIDGKRYIRVIDYKRSSRDFSLADIYGGNNLQSLIYMFGECANTPGTLPSSVMYMPVGLMSYTLTDGGSIEESIKKSSRKYITEHSPSGLIVGSSPENAEIAELNKQLEERFGKKKGGYISLSEVSESVYSRLESYCESYIGTKVKEPSNGMISACPESRDACKYCTYKLFCGHG
ncbi:MAG: PD-(D/E)XK nuclease family protein [Ruminiclostridium sp.]|nr:PD-(D/E)XK nuclease family protein [Ruminiclostridium sp.]